MSDLFYPFIQPTDGWKLHKHFGQADEIQPGSLILASYVQTNSDKAGLYPVTTGKLTLYPPLATVSPFLESKKKNVASRPSLGHDQTVTLYLTPQFARLGPEFSTSLEFLESSQNYHLTQSVEPQLKANYLHYFAYYNVHLDSVRIFSNLSETQWQGFLSNGYDLNNLKEPFGLAGPAPGGSGWQAGFAIITKQGPFDPGTFYQEIKSYGSQPDQRDALVNLLEKHWPLIPADANPDTVGANTLYPFSALLEYKNNANNGEGLTYRQWRNIGDRQKTLYQHRLLKRTRPTLAPDPNTVSFVYNMEDLFNVFQLEAVAEFYMNFDDPWHANSNPKVPGQSPQPRVNLLPIYGTAATVADQKVIPDDDVDWYRLTPGLDVISFANDNNPARPTKQYRIILADLNNGTLTVDQKPEFSRPTPWTISHRPSLVLIDAFGYRVAGSTALPMSSSSMLRLANLNGAQLSELDKLNTYFDTIALQRSPGDLECFRIVDYRAVCEADLTLENAPDALATTGVAWEIVSKEKLSGSKAKPGGSPNVVHLEDVKKTKKGTSWKALAAVMERVAAGEDVKVRLTINGAKKDFRILEVKAHVVLEVDRPAANLPPTGAAWSIPGGVGGAAGWVERPDKSARYGWDHYDGLLFVVLNGVIEDAIPWTSYSARVKKNGKDMSSIRGNRRYTIRSYLSSKHSFTFQIADEWADIAGALAHKVGEVNGQKKSPIYKLDRKLKSTLADKRMYKMVYSKREKKEIKKPIYKLSLYTYASADNLLMRRLITSLDEDNDEVTLAHHKDPLADTSWRIVLYDGAHEARYYFQPPLKIDDCPPDEIPPYGKLNLGKGSIRLHTGYIYSSTTGNGSEGCVVSPYYYYLRNLLVQHHLAEYEFFYAGNTNRSNIEKVRSPQKTSTPAERLVRVYKRIAEFKENEGAVLKAVTERLDQLLQDTILPDAERELFEEMLLIIERMKSVMVESEDAGDEPDPTEYLELANGLVEIMGDQIVSDKLIGDPLDVIGAAIVEWRRRLERLEKQLSEEIDRLGWWYYLIIGDLWLIRPDERPIPETTPTP